MERIWAGHIYVVRVVTKFIQGKGKTLPKAVWSLPGWMEEKKGEREYKYKKCYENMSH
jgi:hypothetical protein